MQHQANVKAVICPPCGESVAVATKEGQNWKKTLWSLLPRLTAVLPPQGREMSHGFTLIELLVVVLIIGILAAVALPQYRKAVEKSKATQAITLLTSVAHAIDVYYLANSEYPTQFSQLDIDIPWTGNEPWATNSVKDTRSNGEWSLQISADIPNWYDLWVGRLTGPYAGTGFKWTFFSNSSNHTRELICAERINHGIEFETTVPGSYCQGIISAGNKIQEGSYRGYAMQ